MNQIPQAIGPYSTHRVTNSLVFTSGQIGLDPVSGNLVGESVEEQTHQALKNLQAVLNCENLTLNNVLKTTVYLANMDDFTKVNDIYASYFKEPFPARTAIEISKLPKGAKIEIEAIAER